MYYQMDGCESTNKSQYANGSLALFIITGIVDRIRLEHMVPGHIKLSPDLVARHIESRYNKADTLNQYQL